MPDSGFASRLLSWYRTNRRDLPWRREPSPYRIWISEIMLQQTRIDTVVPYFERFVARLPDVAALAAVSEDDLFKLWEGLGYYRRAANLRKAAIRILEIHGGILPDDRDSLLALPGIGEYTAGAIRAIAFEKADVAVDGNVGRVLARAFGIEGDVSRPAVRRRIRETALAHLPAEAAGDYVQALMELGALVCVPNGSPRCGECPLSADCYARANDRIGAFPGVARALPRRIEDVVVFAVVQDGRLALERRPAGGLLASLWGLPTIAGTATAAEAVKWALDHGLSPVRIASLPERTHVFTHVVWRMHAYLVETAPGSECAGCTFFDRETVRTRQALPQAFKGYAEAAFEGIG